jgi:hypothetical protein
MKSLLTDVLAGLALAALIALIVLGSTFESTFVYRGF